MAFHHTARGWLVGWLIVHVRVDPSLVVVVVVVVLTVYVLPLVQSSIARVGNEVTQHAQRDFPRSFVTLCAVLIGHLRRGNKRGEQQRYEDGGEVCTSHKPAQNVSVKPAFF